MSATVAFTSVGGPDSVTIRLTVTVTGGVSAPYDFVFDWEDNGTDVTVVTTSDTTVTRTHTYDVLGAHDLAVWVLNHGDDPNDFAPDFEPSFEALNVYGTPKLRIFPRDDAGGHAPRQGKTSRSIQASARQGWVGTYR